MATACLPQTTRGDCPALKIFVPDDYEGGAEVYSWSVGLYRADLHIWDRAAYALLATPPRDARPLPGGHWGALRMEWAGADGVD